MNKQFLKFFCFFVFIYNPIAEGWPSDDQWMYEDYCTGSCGSTVSGDGHTHQNESASHSEGGGDSQVTCLSMTTESGAIKCQLELSSQVYTVRCFMSEFPNVSEVFYNIPSEKTLSETFSVKCFFNEECAEKYQCERNE